MVPEGNVRTANVLAPVARTATTATSLATVDDPACQVVQAGSVKTREHASAGYHRARPGRSRRPRVAGRGDGRDDHGLPAPGSARRHRAGPGRDGARGTRSARRKQAPAARSRAGIPGDPLIGLLVEAVSELLHSADHVPATPQHTVTTTTPWAAVLAAVEYATRVHQYPRPEDACSPHARGWSRPRSPGQPGARLLPVPGPPPIPATARPHGVGGSWNGSPRTRRGLTLVQRRTSRAHLPIIPAIPGP